MGIRLSLIFLKLKITCRSHHCCFHTLLHPHSSPGSKTPSRSGLQGSMVAGIQPGYCCFPQDSDSHHAPRIASPSEDRGQNQVLVGLLPQQPRAKVVRKTELGNLGHFQLGSSEPGSLGLVCLGGSSSLKEICKAKTNKIQTRLISSFKKLFQMQQKLTEGRRGSRISP